MTRSRHAFTHRAFLWAGLGLALLAHVQVAHAVEWKNTSDYVWYGSGNVKEANIGTGSGATILDIKGSYNGATIGKTSTLDMGGHKVPVTAIAKVAAPSLGKAIARFAAGVVPVVAAGIATAQLLNDINVIMRTPQGGGPNQFYERTKLDGTGWEYYENVNTYPSASAACNAMLSAVKVAEPALSWTLLPPQLAADQSSLLCSVEGKDPRNGATYVNMTRYNGRKVATGGEQEKLISLDDLATKIARESGWPDPTNLGNILREAIASGQPVEVGSPTVTGPASTQGAPVTKTTTNPQGQSITTTTNTTNNYTYNDNKVTNTPTTVTTTVNNNTGEKKEETETTDDKRTECQKNPDSLSCATTDVPDGTIPKKDRNLTYSEDSRFSAGGGTCPPDAYARMFGQDMKVWDWTNTCNQIVTYVRPVVLVLAVWIAVAMLVPGKGD